MEGTESKFVARGCSVVVVGVAGSRSLSMDAPLFVERDSVRNDGVDAHRARGASLFRLRQQQQQKPMIRDRRGTSPRLCRAVNREGHRHTSCPVVSRFLESCGLWRKVSRLRVYGVYA